MPEEEGVSWVVYAIIILVFISVILLVLHAFGITSRYFGNMSVINTIIAAFLLLIGIKKGI
jgi:predicted ferric reductase